MGNTVIAFSEVELMAIESILMDDDKNEALTFIKEVIKPKLRAKGSVALDPSKTSGIMT